MLSALSIFTSPAVRIQYQICTSSNAQNSHLLPYRTLPRLVTLPHLISQH